MNETERGAVKNSSRYRSSMTEASRQAKKIMEKGHG